MHLKLVPRLLLEFDHLGYKIAVEKYGIVPDKRFEGRRRHIFR